MSCELPTLLAVFAHPDDEAFGTGGTLARYAEEGSSVYLVTATRGEAGGISAPGTATASNLPEVRERELRCACEAYGAQPPLFLDYADGHLPIVHQGQAVGKLVRIIRDIRPQVVITFGPDGVYGHYDHIGVHRWTTIAVDLSADPACFPDHDGGSCKPFRVSKLYYLALPEEQVARMAREGMAAVMMDGVPFPFVGRSEGEITTVVDVADYAEAKLRGILCHTTQIAEDQRTPQAIEETMGDEAFGAEHFVLAHSTVGWPSEVETDLFERLV
jgi:LmbE family N-acetylglucosaminyl deacetylase